MPDESKWDFPVLPADVSDSLWWYRAQWITNYDGDTIDLLVDQGAANYHRWRIRVYGVDTPELRGKERSEGLVAKAVTANFLTSGEDKRTLNDWLDSWPLYVRTIKDRKGKYGRYLAVVYISEGKCLNGELVDTHHWPAPISWK